MQSSYEQAQKPELFTEQHLEAYEASVVEIQLSERSIYPPNVGFWG